MEKKTSDAIAYRRSIRLYKNEEIDPTEPRELLDFDQQVEINIKWKKKVDEILHITNFLLREFILLNKVSIIDYFSKIFFFNVHCNIL